MRMKTRWHDPSLGQPCALRVRRRLCRLAGLPWCWPRRQRGPASQRVAVFGTDERVPLPAAHAQGRRRSSGSSTNSRSRTVCTAFCVAPDIVATAAHCLYRTGRARRRACRSFQFTCWHRPSARARIAGDANGAPEPARHLRVDAASTSTRRSTRHATGRWFGWPSPSAARACFRSAPKPVAEVVKLSAQGHVFQLAYHRDLTQWQLAYSTPAAACGATSTTPTGRRSRRDFSKPDQLLLHTCDTGGASSGSPLLVDGRRRTGGGRHQRRHLRAVEGDHAERRGAASLQGRDGRQHRRQRRRLRPRLEAVPQGRDR